MRARVGDLAIARFDPSDEDRKQGKKWSEVVCIVTGCDNFTMSDWGMPREFEFIYWKNVGNRVEVDIDLLPCGRLVRARPKRDGWDGTLKTLALDDVEPVLKDTSARITAEDYLGC